MWIKFLIITLILLFSQLSIGQSIVKNYNRYDYQGQTYKYSQMRDIFDQDSEAYNSYAKAIKRKNSATILGLSSIFSAIAGWVILRTSDTDRGEYVSYGFGAVLLYIVTPATGITATALNISSKKYKDKSIDQFNQGTIGSPLSNHSPAYVDIGFTSNGMGFMINF